MSTLPVAEIFSSPQGEGRWCGAFMTFIRLAGCSVGKPFSVQEREELAVLPYQEKCKTWTGESFACDTAYKMTAKYSVPELMAMVGSVPRICLTGGEPLMHDIRLFLQTAWEHKKVVHIETSGTVPYSHFSQGIGTDKLWICVSPKLGYITSELAWADEIKILVGTDFDEAQFVKLFEEYIIAGKVYIQPINDALYVSKEGVAKCLQLQAKYPSLLLSVQLHKFLGVR